MVRGTRTMATRTMAGLAQQRIDAVKKAFEQRGIDVSRFEQDIQVSDVKTNVPSSSNRRVDMRAIQ
jgi:hypothetical protein